MLALALPCSGSPKAGFTCKRVSKIQVQEEVGEGVGEGGGKGGGQAELRQNPAQVTHGDGRSASQAVGTGPCFLRTSSTPLCNAPESRLGCCSLASRVCGWDLAAHAVAAPTCPVLDSSHYQPHLCIWKTNIINQGVRGLRFLSSGRLHVGSCTCVLPSAAGPWQRVSRQPQRVLSGAALFHPSLSSGSLAVSSNLPLIQKDAK